MSDRYCKRFIVLGMGFTQKKGKRNGITELAGKVRHHLANTNKLGHTCLRVVRWNTDAKDMASSIADIAVRNSNPDPDDRFSEYDCQIEIYAYSWGCGNMTQKLCKQLDKRNIKVRKVIFSDPVFRSKIPLFRFIAVTRYIKKWFSVLVRKNVKEIGSFYQKNNVPAGFKLKLQDPIETKILFNEDLTDKQYRHNNMDDAPEFHKAVVESVIELDI